MGRLMGKGTQRQNFQILFFTDSYGGFNEETSVENRLKKYRGITKLRHLCLSLSLSLSLASLSLSLSLSLFSLSLSLSLSLLSLSLKGISSNTARGGKHLTQMEITKTNNSFTQTLSLSLSSFVHEVAWL